MTESSTPQDAKPVLHDPGDATGTLAFLCGADMNPSLIGGSKGRAGLERARFVAIARIDGTLTGRAGLPPDLASGEIWGIALAIAPAADPARSSSTPIATVSIVWRDGTSAEAALMTDPTTVGTVADVLSEAHYWELPVAYRNRLQALVSRASIS